MKLIIASSNAHKLVEIREILGGHFEEIVSLREAGIDHETVEDGQSFLENARKKARADRLLRAGRRQRHLCRRARRRARYLLGALLRAARRRRGE